MTTMMMEVDQEALQDYLDTLQEYRQMVRGGGGGRMSQTPSKNTMYQQGNNIYDQDEEEYYYQKDDGYEGDLLASLGAIYLSRGDASRALAHLEQAVQLYHKKHEDRDRSMADVKLNLAMAYYRLRRFDDSQRVQFEGLDIYRELYGDGVNPYLQGLEEYEDMLMEAMGTPPKDKKTADGKDSPMINLEGYRQSIKNATEAMPKSVKEEL
jgi:tetratricopeptide (TPR) repeat protein